MKNQINIAEILKNCPRGMELDCTICNGVKFIELDRNPNFPIVVRANNGYEFTLTKYGQVHNIDDAKCVIYPKGKTTWDGFVPPCEFKDGDIVTWKDGMGSLVACIYKERLDMSFSHHIALYKGGLGIIVNGEIILTNDELRLATEEEKKKLFDAIKENGYKWNPETKTLEKLPKFKVGDKIIKKNGLHIPFVITGLSDFYYWSNTENSVEVLPVADQDDWELELSTTKFDITTLVPFESKVLIRNGDRDIWRPAIFGGYKKNENNEIEYYYALGGTCWRNCIPYEGNEHLRGTTDDCDEYYKM